LTAIACAFLLIIKGGDRVSKGKADLVSKGKADRVSKGKADLVSKGKADLVSKGKADLVSKGKADLVSKGKVDRVSQGKADAFGEPRSGIALLKGRPMPSASRGAASRVSREGRCLRRAAERHRVS
jgi:hypothetical protein